MLYRYFETGDIPTDKEKNTYTIVQTYHFHSIHECFFNPDLFQLLLACTIPAGLAPLSVVFIGLQTSILCFPRVIFFQGLIQSKIHLKAFFFKVKL